MSEESTQQGEEEVADATPDASAVDTATDTPTGEQVVEEAPAQPAQQTALDGPTDPSARYHVYDEEDSVDWEQSFTKQSDAYKALNSKLGSRARPNSVDDYQWEVAEDAPVDHEGITRLLNKAHELDFSIDQVTGLKEFFESEANQPELGLVNQADTVTETLQSAWQGEYSKNIDAAKTAAAQLNLDITDPEIGNNAPLIQLLARINPKIQEDKAITGRSASGVISRDEYERITAVTDDGKTLGDALHPYWEPENQKKVEEYLAAQ